MNAEVDDAYAARIACRALKKLYFLTAGGRRTSPPGARFQSTCRTLSRHDDQAIEGNAPLAEFGLFVRIELDTTPVGGERVRRYHGRH